MMGREQRVGAIELPGQRALIGEDVAGKTLEMIECEHLASWMVKNGCKAPTVTQAWLAAARRMREIDGRTHEQIMRCIDWCQQSEFWQANIHSMPKLRERYDVLRQQAINDKKRKPSRTGRQSASDVRRMIAMGEG